jgi:hypothetical protein
VHCPARPAGKPIRVFCKYVLLEGGLKVRARSPQSLNAMTVGKPFILKIFQKTNCFPTFIGVSIGLRSFNRISIRVSMQIRECSSAELQLSTKFRNAHSRMQ